MSSWPTQGRATNDVAGLHVVHLAQLTDEVALHARAMYSLLLHVPQFSHTASAVREHFFVVTVGHALQRRHTRSAVALGDRASYSFSAHSVCRRQPLSLIIDGARISYSSEAQSCTAWQVLPARSVSLNVTPAVQGAHTRSDETDAACISPDPRPQVETGTQRLPCPACALKDTPATHSTHRLSASAVGASASSAPALHSVVERQVACPASG